MTPLIARNMTQSHPQRVEHTAPLGSTDTPSSVALPSTHTEGGLPDSEAHSGHSSLLIGIIATLARAGSVDSSNASILSSLPDYSFSSDRSLRMTDEMSDRLVQIYLERVNPRYPFLHLDTFLGWYESWKARPPMDTRDQNSLWKDFFVTMVRQNTLESGNGEADFSMVSGTCCCFTFDTSGLC